MELVYSVTPPVKIRRDWGREEAAICTLSPRNTIAFTSAIVVSAGKNLDESPGNSRCLVEGWYHVYVCDIDKPWDVYHISSFKEKIIALKWHSDGSRILITTVTGVCQVWEMQSHLMNDWECIHSSDTNEELVNIAWLHSGAKVSFNCDMKDSPVYTDKITRSKFKPSLSHFGGKPVDGWIAVTSTGLICLGLLENNADARDNQVKKETLGSCRSRIQVADLAFDSSGDVLVVASDGFISSSIQSYKVTLSYESGQCKISCNATASLYAKCHQDKSMDESPTSRITHIRYMHDDCGDSLIVAAGDTNSSHVELWNSTNEVSRLHRVYQASVETTYTTQRWVHQQSITHGSLPISIATPRFPVLTKLQHDPHSVLFQYVAIAYRDGSVKLVAKSDFRSMTTTNLDIGVEVDMGEKKRRVVAHMTHMQQTLTGCGLVGLDQYHCLYVMKVVNTRDPVTQISPTYLVGMMEYLICNGCDWWDMLTAIKSGMVETIISKLSDNFTKQTAVVQELMYSQFMAVKASLFRSSPGSQQRAADCHCKLVLHSISTLFKSILRPKSISGMEKSPAEKLTANCSKNYETDLSKVIVTLNLEKKEFVVEAMVLQSIQQLIQWVADLTLYLLSSLHMVQGYVTFPGSLLLRDSVSLGALRELLVIIRIWGMISESCQPHFLTTSTNFDTVGHLFKLLTRVWITVKDGSGGGMGDFDDGLIDECFLLSSQVIAPPVDEGLFGDSKYSASILIQTHPLKFVFNQIPASVARVKPQLTLPDGLTMSRQRKDIVRFVTLGGGSTEQLRQCSRCTSLSLIKSSTKVLKAWELRFAKSCICGGQWKRHRPMHSD